MQTRKLDATVDRRAGVEVLLNGEWVRFSGTIPAGLEVAYNEPANDRVAVLASGELHRVAFRRLFVFHGLGASGSLRLDAGARGEEILPSSGGVPLPDVVKSADTNMNGDTIVWQPSAGRRFRLMRYKVFISGDATASVAGAVTLSWKENAALLIKIADVYLPTVAQNTIAGWQTGWVDLGAGILASAADAPLKIGVPNLSAGFVSVVVAGREE